jgi:hypothetical protein
MKREQKMGESSKRNPLVVFIALLMRKQLKSRAPTKCWKYNDNNWGIFRETTACSIKMAHKNVLDVLSVCPFIFWGYLDVVGEATVTLEQ